MFLERGTLLVKPGPTKRHSKQSNEACFLSTYSQQTGQGQLLPEFGPALGGHPIEKAILDGEDGLDAAVQTCGTAKGLVELDAFGCGLGLPGKHSLLGSKPGVSDRQCLPHYRPVLQCVMGLCYRAFPKEACIPCSRRTGLLSGIAQRGYVD